MPQNNEALYGDSPKHSDYTVGDVITFKRPSDAKPRAGEILHVVAPHTTGSGQHVPLSFMVDDASGFPVSVYASDVIQ